MAKHVFVLKQVFLKSIRFCKSFSSEKVVVNLQHFATFVIVRAMEICKSHGASCPNRSHFYQRNAAPPNDFLVVGVLDSIGLC